ncbi:MAG: DUF2062 domain-containing protein [Planctomycetota bacterium]|jgi:uncharacterized protein (DUF2062 family)
MYGLWEKRLKQPVMALLKQGISHEKIALSISVGFTLGIFPVLGTTTALCAAAAFILRLNLPAIQLVNYIVYPLQLFFLVPFLKAGGWLFGDQRYSQLGKEIIDLMKNDVWSSFGILWDLTVYAVVLWLILSPLMMVVLYKTLKPALGRLPLDKLSPGGNRAKI